MHGFWLLQARVWSLRSHSWDHNFLAGFAPLPGFTDVQSTSCVVLLPLLRLESEHPCDIYSSFIEQINKFQAQDPETCPQFPSQDVANRDHIA